MEHIIPNNTIRMIKFSSFISTSQKEPATPHSMNNNRVVVILMYFEHKFNNGIKVKVPIVAPIG